MRVLVQRVRRARVTVAEETTGEIGRGFLLLVGVTLDDTAVRGGSPGAQSWQSACLSTMRTATSIARRSILLEAGEPIGMLVVSQFTLYADCRKGRRPSFVQAAPPAIAEPLVDRFADGLRALGLPVATGRFGAEMQVELVNDGPVTIWLDTAEL